MSELVIRQAHGEADLATVRTMIIDYAASFGFSLCFDGLDRELAALPGPYAPPSGRLLIAELSGEPAGCGALRPLAGPICEMKRLYVRPALRRHGLGARLVSALLDEARAAGYRLIRLDTMAVMTDAQALYRGLGFRAIPAYYPDPEEGVAFFEKSLDPDPRPT